MEWRWFYLGGAFLLGILLWWLRTRIRYRITADHLKVTLFGLCLRRIRLTDIESVSKRRTSWAEHWWNTWRPWRRRLVIRRRSGLFRNFVITPKRRYEFRATLEKAVKEANAGA